MELDVIHNEDCIEGMKRIPDKSIDCILTDIPYNEVNKSDMRKKGIRVLNKGVADIGEFDIVELTQMLLDKTKGSAYIFCGFEQVSTIVSIMRKNKLTPRIIVWEKTNPSPIGGGITT